MAQTRSGRRTHASPQLPNEVWREILLYLSYHDLKKDDVYQQGLLRNAQ